MSKRNNINKEKPSAGAIAKREKRMRQVESTATIGLILVAISLIGPFTDTESVVMLKVFKWIYASGALIYLVARVVGSIDKGLSLRLRRLRRMEAWAGMALAVGAFFWFYNAGHHGESYWTLQLLNNTILFTLVGAVIQIIASWLIYSVQRKEQRAAESDSSDSKDKK